MTSEQIQSAMKPSLDEAHRKNSQNGKMIVASAYAHPLTEMKRVDYPVHDICLVHSVIDHPTLGRCYIGWWLAGLGTVDNFFPVADARLANAEEKSEFMSGRWCEPGGHKWKLKGEDFATEEFLAALPVVGLTPEPRQLRKVHLSAADILKLLPPGTELVAASLLTNYDPPTLSLTVRHASFSPVAEGAELRVAQIVEISGKPHCYGGSGA